MSCMCTWCSAGFNSARTFYAHHDAQHPGKRALVEDVCPGSTGPGTDARAEDQRRAKQARRLAANAGVDVETFESFVSSLLRFEISADSGVAFRNGAALASRVSADKIALVDPPAPNQPSVGNPSGGRCEWCHAPIANFSAGRQIRADRRFCKDAHRKAARRAAATMAVIA